MTINKNNQNSGISSSSPAAVQALASSPVPSADFKREICLVVYDRAGKELFRSAPVFSSVEAERIGDQGADEYFAVGLAPVDGVTYPGMKWTNCGFYWTPETVKVQKESAA